MRNPSAKNTRGKVKKKHEESWTVFLARLVQGCICILWYSKILKTSNSLVFPTSWTALTPFLNVITGEKNLHLIEMKVILSAILWITLFYGKFAIEIEMKAIWFLLLFLLFPLEFV